LETAPSRVPGRRLAASPAARRLSDREEILLGGAYTNIKYDFGQSHARRRSSATAATSGGRVGFDLYGGNKPQSFKDEAEEDPIFSAPMVFMGWRFWDGGINAFGGCAARSHGSSCSSR
jgi:hypothetical protein